MGRLDEAIELYRTAVKLCPQRGDYHSNLVYTLNNHPGYDPATALFYAPPAGLT